MEVLLGAVLVNAFHAALEDRIVTLNRVRADDLIALATNIFLALVVHGVMAGELLTDRAVRNPFVRHHRGFTREIGANDRLDVRDGCAIDVEATGLAAAFNQSQHRVLVGERVRLLANWLAFLPTDERLINLNRLALAAHRGQIARSHRLADAMAHEPSGLQRHAQRAVKLVGADAFLAGTHQINSLKPERQRNVAILEHRTLAGGELAPADGTLLQAVANHAFRVLLARLRADAL